jgi:hypothetical protein
MSRTHQQVPDARTAVRPPADLRRLWRTLLAIVAPLPMLSMGLWYVLSPVDGDASFEETLAAYTADPGRAWLVYLTVPFLVLLVPATAAVVLVVRRHAPRLATAGGLIAVGGMIGGFGILPGAPDPVHLVVAGGLDAPSASRVAAAMESDVLTLVGSLLFILGVTVGLLLLGIALWRSQLVPAWAGVALALGGFTHPFMPGHVATGIGLLLAAVGYAGAGRALLRTSDEDFDLPPARPGWASGTA